MCTNGKMRKLTTLSPAIGIHRWHRHFHRAVIQAERKYPKLDEYYQKNATKFWDNFYKRHKNKFFKDRHYLEKDWGQYFSDDARSLNGKIVLEVGCGAGNTIFPLLAAYPKLYVQACDISPQAVELVKSHVEFNEDRVNAFVFDVTADDLFERINPSSIDVITLPDGHVLLRDYAIGDFAQVKLEKKNQMISEDFYVRCDGTCSFYFSEDFLSTLFSQAGFNTLDISTYCKQIKNRHKNISMDRRWIRAVFNLG